MAASEAIGRDMLLKGQCIGQVRAVMAFASISWVVVQSQQSSVWTHDTTPTSSCLVPVPSSRCSSPWWRNCWLKSKAWHVLYSSCFDPPPFFDIEWPHLTLMLWMCRWKVAFWACQGRATGWAGRWGGTSPKVCGRGRWIFGWGWPDYHDSHADQPDPEDEKMDPHDVTYIWSWLLHAMMQRKSDNVRTARQKRALRFKFARQFLLDFEIWKHNNWHWLIWSEWVFLKLRWNGNNDPICGWCWRFTSWKSEDNLRVEFKPCAAWNVFFPKVSPRPKHIQYEAGSFKVAQIKFLKPRWWRMVSWRNESEAVAASRSNQVHSCYDALWAPTHPQGPRRNRSGAVLGVPSGTKALQWPCWTPCPCLKFMLLSFFVS